MRENLRESGEVEEETEAREVRCEAVEESEAQRDMLCISLVETLISASTSTTLLWFGYNVSVL